ncbi:glycerophosphodiester phosphodiesterase [Paenibacillus thalictri]|uniref:Glycerophosphodiester phosphodiesterase n=1 Tax=Paenibacillus thalictri TaxID=2527873 RepID=A0A4Q9DIY8_9BACL|nr:glycerophosphodiester phosphodiesterase [Paenibacillus thalictri]TBL72695.1 glycerophosphodiester phosphodiesterase [Paenibacillus thalictri]
MTAQKPMNIAHRGAKGLAPENTLAAFRLGMEHGCEGIELDIHLSADGEIIVCHDESLDRTTNGTGAIRGLTLSEIKSYDAGEWFGEQYRGETVPTLGEVFDLVPASIMINVEVKDHVDEQIERKLVDFLRERGRLDNVVVSSFDHQCVRRIKQLEPNVKIGLLYALNLVEPAAYAHAFDVDVYSLHPHFTLVDSELMQKAAEYGLVVFPWTVNDEKDLLHVTELGVSGIITDFPGRYRDLLAGK